MDMTWLEKLAGAEGWIGLGLLALLVLLLLIFIIRFKKKKKKCEQAAGQIQVYVQDVLGDYEETGEAAEKKPFGDRGRSHHKREERGNGCHDTCGAGSPFTGDAGKPFLG